MSDKSVFASWLRRERQTRGLTQDELAERVGCASQTIRKIEGGQRRPSYQMAERLAQVLQLDTGERSAWMRVARELDEEAAPPAAPAICGGQSSAPRIGLPVYLTPCIGRDQDCTNLATVLRTPECRLVTVIGPGGIGKTRLAVDVARFVDGFADGVAFVSLATVSEPRAIAAAIADTLGLTGADQIDLFAQLCSYLRRRDMLIVLDNLEHLLDSAGDLVGLLGQFLAEAPHITLLATSRERLKMQTEWAVELAGLSVPPEDPREAPADYAAFTLFLEHARRVQPGLRLSADDERAVTQICRLLEGMPLGIELAAGWVMTLGCVEIAAEMQRGLDFLEQSDRDLPQRHRSIRVVFEHSWQLLTPEEQALLVRVAVFRGGFTREAATFVSHLSLPALAGLVRKSLVRSSGGQRYELHAVTRRFAAEKLERTPERAMIRQRFFDYYLALSAGASQGFADYGDRSGYDALAPEIDNLRDALQQAVSGGQAEQGARLNTALRMFWELQSRYHEGIAWSQRLLKRGGLSDAARGDLLLTVSHLARTTGADERAWEAGEAALSAHRQSGDADGLSWAMGNLAQLHLAKGDYAMARALQLELIAARSAVSGPHLLAWDYIRLVAAELLLGDRAFAEEHHAEALRLARSIDDRFTEGGAYNSYGLGLTLSGDRAGAAAAAKAFELLSDPAYPWGMLVALEVLAAQAGMRGQHEVAGRLAGAARQLRQQHQLGGTAIYKSDYERLAGLARGALTDDAWELALRQGVNLAWSDLRALAHQL